MKELKFKCHPSVFNPNWMDVILHLPDEDVKKVKKTWVNPIWF